MHILPDCAEKWAGFIGPEPESMERLSDKAVLKELVGKTGLTVIPGSRAVQSLDEAKSVAGKIGYPVMLKACTGGGGRGIRLIESADELDEAYVQAVSEALNAFGDGSMYLENTFFLQDMWNFRFLQMNSEMLCVWVKEIVHCREEIRSLWRRHHRLPYRKSREKI